MSVSSNKYTPFPYRWPGFYPLCSCSFNWSSDSSSPTSGHSLQVSSSQSKPVRSTPAGLQHQSSPRRTFGSFWLRQELQRVLRFFGSFSWQHTEWPLQDSSSWVYSSQRSVDNSATICKILSLYFMMYLHHYTIMLAILFFFPTFMYFPHEYSLHKQNPPTFIMLRFALYVRAPPQSQFPSVFSYSTSCSFAKHILCFT